MNDKALEKEIGRKIARENAKQQIWKLEGYLLKNRLYIDEQSSSGYPDLLKL